MVEREERSQKNERNENKTCHQGPDGESLEQELRCSEGVRAILECPVCLEVFSLSLIWFDLVYLFLSLKVMSECKIYQCKFGHNVCERCCRNPLLSSCPQCRWEHAIFTLETDRVPYLKRVMIVMIWLKCEIVAPSRFPLASTLYNCLQRLDIYHFDMSEW